MLQSPSHEEQTTTVRACILPSILALIGRPPTMNTRSETSHPTPGHVRDSAYVDPLPHPMGNTFSKKADHPNAETFTQNHSHSTPRYPLRGQREVYKEKKPTSAPTHTPLAPTQEKKSMRLSPSTVIVLVIVGSVALALLAAAMSLMARRQSQNPLERSHFDPPDTQRAYMKSVQRSNMNDMAQIVWIVAARVCWRG